MTIKKKKNIYLDNKEFLAALEKYKEECKNCKTGRPQSKTYQFLGKCWMEIATKLSNSPNFFGYSYKDEMILDAVMDCSLRFENFDTEKSSNAFAYFTQICWYAFVRRIKAEHKQRDVRSAVIYNSGVLDELPTLTDDGEIPQHVLQYLLEGIDKPKEKLDKKFKKTTKAHQAKLKELDEKIETQEKSFKQTYSDERGLDKEEVFCLDKLEEWD